MADAVPKTNSQYHQPIHTTDSAAAAATATALVVVVVVMIFF